MASYVIEIPEQTLMGKKLIAFLKSLSLSIAPVKSETVKPKKNGLDKAIEELEKGQVTTYENAEEYKRAMHKMLGYV